MDKFDFLTEILISDFPLMKAAKILILLKLDHEDVYNKILAILNFSDDEIEEVIRSIIWLAGRHLQKLQEEEIFKKGPSFN